MAILTDERFIKMMNEKNKTHFWLSSFETLYACDTICVTV